MAANHMSLEKQIQIARVKSCEIRRIYNIINKVNASVSLSKKKDNKRKKQVHDSSSSRKLDIILPADFFSYFNIYFKCILPVYYILLDTYVLKHKDTRVNTHKHI